MTANEWRQAFEREAQKSQALEVLVKKQNALIEALSRELAARAAARERIAVLEAGR